MFQEMEGALPNVNSRCRKTVSVYVVIRKRLSFSLYVRIFRRYETYVLLLIIINVWHWNVQAIRLLSICFYSTLSTQTYLLLVSCSFSEEHFKSYCSFSVFFANCIHLIMDSCGVGFSSVQQRLLAASICYNSFFVLPALWSTFIFSQPHV